MTQPQVVQHPFVNGMLSSGPQRRLAVATLIDTVGTGLNYAILPIFLIREAGVSAAQIGLAMSIAAGIGLPAGFALGHVADCRGPRSVVVSAYFVQALAAGILPFVRSFPSILAVLCLTIFGGEGGRTVRYTVIARLGADRPVRYRAQLRVVSNLGVAVGAGIGGISATFGNREAYTVALLGNAASFLFAAIIQATLPALPPTWRQKKEARQHLGQIMAALGDRPYLAVTAVSALLMIQNQVLILAIPLWIITTGVAPTWTVSVVLMVNTAMVVMFQIHMASGISTPVAAGRSWRRAGLAFLITCSLVPLTRTLPMWAAVVLILVAVAVHSLGEVWHSAGIFEIALGLAPKESMGKYQGVFNLGEGITTVFSPAVVIFFCITWGTPGWLILGFILFMTGLAAPTVALWAQRTLPAPTRRLVAEDEELTLPSKPEGQTPAVVVVDGDTGRG